MIFQTVTAEHKQSVGPFRAWNPALLQELGARDSACGRFGAAGLRVGVAVGGGGVRSDSNSDSPSPLHLCLATGLAHHRYPANFFKKMSFYVDHVLKNLY